jgi:pimeloyl-ACP methyl ester carboxylesterase
VHRAGVRGGRPERLSGDGVSGDYGNVERLRAKGPKIETEEFAEVTRALAAFHDTAVDFSAIAVPTLVLYGENEPAFVRRHAANLESAMQSATAREVPGAGHAANMDNPEFFTEAVRALLADVTPPETETVADDCES